MKRFDDYIRLRETDQFSDPTGQSEADGIENCLLKIARISWDRYESETKDFFRQLANKDPDIKEQLDKIDSEDNDPASRGEENNDDKDIISPPQSDTNSGSEEDDGGE